MEVTMIGHSTLLIETDGQKIILDPYFGTWGNLAYERLEPPAQPRDSLHDVDLALLSHNHWDHVDSSYFRSLPDSVPVVAPRQTTWLTKLQGAKRVMGIRAWESQQFGAVNVTAVPASHSAITIGFVLQSEGRQIYFAGDTYYRPFLREIGQRFKLDLALLPVTTYRIPMTMGEDEAVLAVRDLSPEVVIPIHLGIRPRSPLMRTNETPEGFERKVRESGLKSQVLHLKPAEQWRS